MKSTPARMTADGNADRIKALWGGCDGGEGCGLGLDSIVRGRGKVQRDCLSLGRICGLKRISYNLHCFMFMIIFNI